MIEKTFNKKIDNIDLKVRVNDIAENANGSVFLEAGGTVVFVTAVMSKNDTSKDYFPLSVEFEEKFYSIGRILGGRFIRREGRPSTEAVLNARIIDRTIRPLFPKHIKRDVQVIVSVISLGSYSPETLGLLGTSIALNISDIPWNGPIGCVKSSRVNGSWKSFPTIEESATTTDHALFCGKGGIITMIEMEGSEVAENEVVKLGSDALNIFKDLESFQKEIVDEIGKDKINIEAVVAPAELIKSFDEKILPKIKTNIFQEDLEDKELSKETNELLNEFELTQQEKDAFLDYKKAQIGQIIQKEIIENGKRADGRRLDEIRPLFAKAGGVSDRLHGSGIFYRGGTRVFSALTLDGPDSTILLNTIESPDAEEYFIHHYNFPPFSTGETGNVGSTKRREIGHGELAKKALKNVIPSREKFPYVIRLVSECFSSNGSTSMGSVCASTLAMLDGGVPIKTPVAGIAMGLANIGDKYEVLTDLQGLEDHYGYMDFKVAGTRNGITAIQLDVKLEGIPLDVFVSTIEKAKVGREKILDVIESEIKNHREKLSSYAPQIKQINISPDKIGLVVGKGGENIKRVQTDYEVDVNIKDSGEVIFTGFGENIEKAVNDVLAMVKDLEVGDVLEGNVSSIKDFGIFVNVGNKKEVMVHISELAPGRVEKINDIIKIGDKVTFIITEVRQDGKLGGSIKQIKPDFFDKVLKSNK